MLPGVSYFVVGVRQATTAFVYTNGGTPASAGISGTADFNTICIGEGLRAAAVGQKFGGMISGLSFFNRALTPTEIQILYTQPLAMIDDSVEILTSSTNIGVATISDPTTNSRFNQTSGFFSYDHY
jgi:hypothetical protein